MATVDPPVSQFPAAARFILALAVAVVVAFLVALNPPVSRPAPAELTSLVRHGHAEAAEDLPGLQAARAQFVPPLPVVTLPAYRASGVVVLRMGPDDRYTAVGQIGNGVRLEVVGRNERGDWLAVSLTPGSRTYGWVRAASIDGISPFAVANLPVVAVRLLR